MKDFTVARAQEAFCHFVGNKAFEESVLLSKGPMDLSSAAVQETMSLLIRNATKSDEIYHFSQVRIYKHLLYFHQYEYIRVHTIIFEC